jgi:transcriptional regulator with XRE-family HTH domain
MANMVVAEKIVLARKEHKKTQEALADHLGIGQQAYSHYELGRSGIPLPRLLKICKFLDLDTEEILSLYEEKEMQRA